MESRLNHWKDRIGIVASVVCAIHCAATPILLACLPALTFTEWMASPRFHQIAAIVCVAMVSLAIWPAFRKFRDYRVLSLSTAGLGLLITAAFVLPDECCSHSLSSNAPADPHAGHDHSGHDHSGHSHASLPPASNQVSSGESHTHLASVVSPELVALIQPWMTPLGGLLLVVAHGLNLRRRMCTNSRCGCHGKSGRSDSGLGGNDRSGRIGLVAVTTKVA